MSWEESVHNGCYCSSWQSRTVASQPAKLLNYQFVPLPMGQGPHPGKALFRNAPCSCRSQHTTFSLYLWSLPTLLQLPPGFEHAELSFCVSGQSPELCFLVCTTVHAATTEFLQISPMAYSTNYSTSTLHMHFRYVVAWSQSDNSLYEQTCPSISYSLTLFREYLRARRIEINPSFIIFFIRENTSLYLTITDSWKVLQLLQTCLSFLHLLVLWSSVKHRLMLFISFTLQVSSLCVF